MAMAMASVGHSNKSLPDGMFHLGGKSFHRIGSMHPDPHVPHAFAQIYVLDVARESAPMLFYNKVPIRDFLTPEFLLAQGKNYGIDLNNYIKIINKAFINNKIIHWSWLNYENKTPLSINYIDMETIKQDTNGLIDDFHYSEKSHIILSKNFINLINKKII
jgi:hypothetical protein